MIKWRNKHKTYIPILGRSHTQHKGFRTRTLLKPAYIQSIVYTKSKWYRTMNRNFREKTVVQ